MARASVSAANLHETPLMWAGTIGAYDAALVLLEAGADLRARNADGLPFTHFFTDDYVDVNVDPKSHYAAMKQKCKELLEKKGVDFRKEKIENERTYAKMRERTKREADRLHELDQRRQREVEQKATSQGTAK